LCYEVHKLIGEILALNVKNVAVGIGDYKLICYSVKKVSFSQARGTVNEERVIEVAGIVGYCLAGIVGKTVSITYYKVFKGIFFAVA